MSDVFRFDQYVPKGAQGQYGKPSQTGQVFQFSQYGTGQNLQGTSSGWDTDFQRRFRDEYNQAWRDGTVGTYFFDKKTGIAQFDQERKDPDTGEVQRVRAGDVYDNGKLVGNLYDQYDPQTADQLMIPYMFNAEEQKHNPDVAARREEMARNYQDAGTRATHDQEIKKIKDEWGDDWDVKAPAAGFAGGAAVGASAGAILGAGFFGVGALAGGLVGGAVGGIAGAVGAWMNRDELEDMAARGAAKEQQLLRSYTSIGGEAAAFSTRLETYGMLAGEAMNPLKQLVHGAADGVYGEMGDGQSGFYDVDPETGKKSRSFAWTAADWLAVMGAEALQFASPLGQLLYQFQMGATVGGKAGSYVATGGSTFDEQSGTFSSTWTNDKGEFTPVAGLAGLGEIGIDVAQMGIARKLSTSAARRRKPDLVTNGWDTVDALRFKMVDGKAVSYKVSPLGMIAPSEAINSLMASAQIRYRQGGGKIDPMDVYRAAQNLANATRPAQAMLVNAIGEGTEEAVQEVLGSIATHRGHDIDMGEVLQAYAQGAFMGAGMTLGTHISGGGRRTQLAMEHQLLKHFWQGTHQPMPEESEWMTLTEQERMKWRAISPEASDMLKRTAQQLEANSGEWMVAQAPEIMAANAAANAEKAKAANRQNTHIEGTYLISKAGDKIADHHVRGSIRTVHEIFESYVKGLKEQIDVRLTEDPKADLSEIGRTLETATMVRDFVGKQVKRFYKTDVTKLRNKIVRELNDVLESLWRIDAKDPESLSRARAVSIDFNRYPFSQAGSFQFLLPQVSYEASQHEQDGGLMITLGPTQALGADFDGDKIRLNVRTWMDDAQFKNVRMGRHLLSIGSESTEKDLVGIMTRDFENAMVRFVNTETHTGPKANRKSINKFYADLSTFLEKFLRDPSGKTFATAEIQLFLDDLKVGREGSKEAFLNRLARNRSEQMRNLAENGAIDGSTGEFVNPWFHINSFFHSRLQTLQMQLASTRKDAVPTAKIVAPIPLDSRSGGRVIEKATTDSLTLSFILDGFKEIRAWQSLVYSSYNVKSDHTLDPVEDADVFRRLAAMYDAISSGDSRPALDELYATDHIAVSTREAMRNFLKLAVKKSKLDTVPSEILFARVAMPDVNHAAQGFNRGSVAAVQWALRETLYKEEIRLRAMGLWTQEIANTHKMIGNYSVGEAMEYVYGHEPMYALIGADASVYGTNLTFKQVVDWYASLGTVDKSIFEKEAKSHAAYTRRGAKGGYIGGAYYVDQHLKGGDKFAPVTEYQAITDAILEAGNNRLGYDPDAAGVLGKGHSRGKAIGRRGVASNKTGKAWRDAIQSIRSAAVALGVDTTSTQEMYELVHHDPRIARALVEWVPASVKPYFYHVDENGQLMFRSWVIDALTMQPAQGEKHIWVNYMLTSWVAKMSHQKPDAENQSADEVAIAYHSLDNMVHRRMYQLVYDQRQGLDTISIKDLEDKFANLSSVAEIERWLNVEARGNFPPIAAWDFDVAAFDPGDVDSTDALQASEIRKGVSELARIANQFSIDAIEASRRRDIMSSLRSQVNSEIGRMKKLGLDYSESDLLATIQKSLRLAGKYKRTLGPEARRLYQASIMQGAQAHAAQKGSTSMEASRAGEVAVLANEITFGPQEHGIFNAYGANSIGDLADAVSVLASDDGEFLDSTGRVVHWKKLDIDRFAELLNSEDNHALLEAILFPVMFDVNSEEGAIRPMSIVNMTLENLTNGRALHDAVFSQDQRSDEVYASMLNGIAGPNTFEKVAHEFQSLQLAKEFGVWDMDDALLSTGRVNSALAQLLKKLAVLAEIEVVDESTGSRVFLIDLLKQEMQQWLITETTGRSASHLMSDIKATMQMINAEILMLHKEREEFIKAGMDVNDPQMQSSAARTLELKRLQDTLANPWSNIPRNRILAKWSLPAKTDKQTEQEWFVDNTDQLLNIYAQLRTHGNIRNAMIGDPDIQTLASAEGVDLTTGKGLDNIGMTAEKWITTARKLALYEIQDEVATVVAGQQAFIPPNLNSDSWARLHDPHFLYLTDIFDRNHPLVEAAIELNRTFNRSETGESTIADIQNDLKKFLLNVKDAKWDDRLPRFINEGHSNMDTSPILHAVQGAGSIPPMEIAHSVATARTTASPDNSMRSQARMWLRQLQDTQAEFDVTRKSGRVEKMSHAEFHGRFINEAVLTAPDGTQIDLMKHPNVALEFQGTQDIPVGDNKFRFKYTDPGRLAQGIEEAVDEYNRAHPSAHPIDPYLVTVDVQFLHVGDQPAGPEWANNVYFGGAISITDGDFFQSLTAAWHMGKDGIDHSGLEDSLKAPGKQRPAWNQAHKPTHAEARALEVGWETDLYGVLARSALDMMQIEMTDGRRISPFLFPAVFERFAMHRLVRGLDPQTKEVKLLSASEVMALQAEGTALDTVLENAELIPLSASALRTMLDGNFDGHGELRPDLEPTPGNILTIPRWTGSITEKHLQNLPGLLQVEPVDMFDTSATQRGFMREIGHFLSVSMPGKSTKDAQLVAYRTRKKELVNARVADKVSKSARLSLDQAWAVAGKYLADQLSITMDSARTSTVWGVANDAAGRANEQKIADSVRQLVERNENALGEVFYFADPDGVHTNEYGTYVGAGTLAAPRKKSQELGLGDIAVVVMDSATQTPASEINAVLQHYIDTGAYINLATSTNAPELHAATQYLRDHGYEQTSASRWFFAPKVTHHRPRLHSARLSTLTSYGPQPVHDRVVGINGRRMPVNVEENAAVITNTSWANASVEIVRNIIPVNARHDFNLAQGHQMTEVRRRLALPDEEFFRMSAAASGKKELTKAEKQDLSRALEKARNHLNDQGQYPSGRLKGSAELMRFQVGDIVPLFNPRTEQIILYRHGHKQHTRTQMLELFENNKSNTIISPLAFDEDTTVHDGELVEYRRVGPSGLQTIMRVPMQALWNKLQVEGSGMKMLGATFLDESVIQKINLPEGIPNWQVMFLLSMADTESKENYEGLMYNFNSAFTWLGVDFRPILAKAFYGPQATAGQIKAVANDLLEFKRVAPQLDVVEIDRLMRHESSAEVFDALYKELSGKTSGILEAKKLQTWMQSSQEDIAKLPVEERIARAALIYMMWEGSSPRHILYAGGVANKDSRERGLYSWKMPPLFTEFFDRTGMEDPLRLFMIQKLQERIQNPNGPQEGWILNPDMTVTFKNRDARYTFEGYLQFAKLTATGDNPTLNMMSQAHKSTQAASEHVSFVAALAHGARTFSTKATPKQTEFAREVAKGETFTAASLNQTYQNIARKGYLDIFTEKTRAEKLYDEAAAQLARGLKPPISTKKWLKLDTKKYTKDSYKRMVSEFDTRVATIAAKLGVPGQNHIVHALIRHHLWSPVDKSMEFLETQGEQKGNDGYVSYESAMQTLNTIEKNILKGRLPIHGAAIGLMDPGHLLQIREGVINGLASWELTDGKGRVLTSVDDWVNWAMSFGEDTEGHQFHPAMLTTIDGVLHRYRDRGLIHTTAISVSQARVEALLDPATESMMMSIDPARAKQLASPLASGRMADFHNLIGVKTSGPEFVVGATDSARAEATKNLNAWIERKSLKYSAGTTLRDAMQDGIRFKGKNRGMAGGLKTMMNLRVLMGTANPQLYLGAPVEQLVQTMLEGTVNFLTGDSQLSRAAERRQIAGIKSEARGARRLGLQAAKAERAEGLKAAGTDQAARDAVEQQYLDTRERLEEQIGQRRDRSIKFVQGTARDARLMLSALATNEDFRTKIFSDFRPHVDRSGAGIFERATGKAADLAGKTQDPYFMARGDVVARRYVESVARAARSAGLDVTSYDVLAGVSTDPDWVSKNLSPSIDRMAMNTLKRMKNVNPTALSSIFRGVLDPAMNSSRMGFSSAATIGGGLKFTFIGYTSSKVLQMSGLQAVDTGLALLLHGKSKGILGNFQAAIRGEPLDVENNQFDFGDVIETLDLTSAFVQSGVTHTGLMAAGLLAGGLGLSGEDDEDRRRRKALKAQGAAHIYDPLDMVNDFRNASAIYLDWLPFGMDAWFKSNGGDGDYGRAAVEMNWLMREIFSPIIGMERFFNNGNPMEIWWGFQDAFYAFPLVNTTFVKDAYNVFEELSESAMSDMAISTPESMPRAYGKMVGMVAELERMLFESSFANMIYRAADPWDRDAWARPERSETGEVLTNRLGMTQRNTALQSFVDETTGEVREGYYGRDWSDAVVHGYAKNRATLAVLGSLYAKISGRDGYMRSDMPVKMRKVAKPEITIEEAEAHVLAAYKGAIQKGDPALQRIYIPYEMRAAIKERILNHEFQRGLDLFYGNESKAWNYAFKQWQGDSKFPTAVSYNDILYGKGENEWFSYSPNQWYAQRNSTYVQGPDGRPWATGIEDRSFLALANIMPFARYMTQKDSTGTVDERLNYVDLVLGVNTGMRGLVPLHDSFKIDDPATGVTRYEAAQGNSNWQDWSSGNYYRSRGGYRRGGGRRRGGGGGGGGGGSFTRIQAPERQQTPYAHAIQDSNLRTQGPRRASVRRDKVESKKGRIKPWQ